MVRLEDGVTRTIDWPEFEVHAVPHPARPARPDPALRPRAGVPLAHVHQDRRRPGRGARRPDGRAARRAAGRRAALAPGLGHRPRDRPGPDPAPALQPPTYEGPTGIVGVLHQALRRRRPARPRRCGRRCRTTSRSRRTRRARWRCCAGSSRSSASPSTPPTSRTRRPTTSSRSRRAVELDPDVQAFVERLERAADEESGRPDPGSLPVAATCWRASSSASCASAASEP